MNTARRKFLKNSTVLAATAAMAPLSSLGASGYYPDLSIAGSKDNEDFWKAVRMNFPLDTKITYLNNGTMGPSPYPVVEAAYKKMLDVDTTGTYGGWEVAVPALAKFTGANENEICLTRNVTEGINIVCWGLKLKKGDEVIITNHEHVGNALPWLNRAKVDGIVLRVVKLAPTAAETLDRISAAINKNTRVIAVPHIPCTNGQVLPVKEICKLAKDKGVYSFIDGAHGPGMLMLDLHDIGCDFYASCCHKWMLAPKGTGFLYVKHEKLNDVQACWVGGYCDTGWDMLSNPPELKGYVDTAHRYYYGSMSAPIYEGVAAAIDFQEKIGREVIQSRILGMAKYFQDKLVQMGDRIEMVTPVEDKSRAALVGFKIKKLPDDKFFNVALAKGIRIRYVAENGLNSLRVSFHIYNNYDEADQLLKLVEESA